MKTKNIKVAYSSRYTGRNCLTVPKLTIEGKWLSELGFTVGESVVVEYEEGPVRIRCLTAEEKAVRDRTAAEAELKHRRAEIKRLQKELAAQAEGLPMVAESTGRYGSVQSHPTGLSGTSPKVKRRRHIP